jgi:hypothetical protein
MSSSKSRRVQRRRDRRKAKASGYRRGAKAGMGSRVGHGASGNVGSVLVTPETVRTVRPNGPIHGPVPPPMKMPIGECVAIKRLGKNPRGGTRR